MRGFLRDLHGEAGQAIVMVAITFLGATMAVGLAIDAGQLYSARRTMQEAADAGAYAGAVVHYQRTLRNEGIDANAAISAAKEDALRNGYEDGARGATVEIYSPPRSGNHVNNSRYVEVIITDQVRTSIVPGGALTTVRVRGVAGAEPLNNAYAIMSLDRGSTCPALRTSPNADIHLQGGGILVNSTCTAGPEQAAHNQQNDPARFTIAAPHGVDVSGNATGIWPPGFPVNSGQPQEPDPFSGFPKPSTVGVPVYNALPPLAPAPTPTVLEPGIYTVTISGTGGTKFVMQPGIYIFKRGISLAGNADLFSAGLDTPATCLTNCGIFMFNTHTNYPNAFRAGIDTCGPVNLQGNAAVRVAPMTTGTASGPDPGDTYNGFLFYQDQACRSEMVIGGNGSFTATGTIYLPSAHFRFDGNNATLTGSQLVAKTVDLQNGDITIDFNAGATAQPILPRLSE